MNSRTASGNSEAGGESRASKTFLSLPWLFYETGSQLELRTDGMCSFFADFRRNVVYLDVGKCLEEMKS